METVSNLTTAASRAIWGDPTKDTGTTQNDGTNEEPRSGETGDVGAGEPYDKGNVNGSTSNTESRNPTSTSHSTIASTTDNPSSAPQSDLLGNTTSTLPVRSENDTEQTGVASATSSHDTSGPGPIPSVGAGPSSATQDTFQDQAAGKPVAEPKEGSEGHKRIIETKKEAEEAAKVDTSGPGSKPLTKKEGSAGPAGPTGIEDDGPQKESLGEGTGEKYVKSSGLKADGGDFDASKPSAAKEADRLLETKGEVPRKSDESTNDDSSGTPEKSGKLSGLKQKIKAKLHKN